MDFETWFKQHVPNAPAGKYHELLAVWDAATLEERERCAKLCDEHRGRVPGHCPDKQMGDLVAQGYGNAALNLGVAIRAPSAS